MGVSVSRPLRKTTKAKYILTFDGGSNEFDGTEEFFSHNLHQQDNRGETSRGGKEFSKWNEAGCLQFKGTKGSSGCPFDSLDTIDSRKSVPFAVLPENNAQSLTRSPSNGEGGFSNAQSDDKTISVKKSSKLSFHDDLEDDLDESLAKQERNTPTEYVQQKVNHHFQGKLREKGCSSRRTRSGEETQLPDENNGDNTRSRYCGENTSDMSVSQEGFVDGRASEQEITMIRADSEPNMVCL